jgi:hypothetical protein
MKFNILYVENDDKDFNPVFRAVRDYNKYTPDMKLHLERALTPEELQEKLDLRFDAILADVFYDRQGARRLNTEYRLRDIIAFVESWCGEQPGDRALPIIAYTRTPHLKKCLEVRGSLYDILDKNSANPDYVVWRFSRLATEVTRSRPDAKLQMLVREMKTGARWHGSVKRMARRYHAGWNERDQVKRVAMPIETIAHELGSWQKVQEWWRCMSTSEWLLRAVSPSVRGHARHVVNVFWLGYWLINNEMLLPFFRDAWRRLIAERRGMGAAFDDDPREALCDIWFYAGLFHDVCGVLEKSEGIMRSQFELICPFFESPISAPAIWPALLGHLKERVLLLSSDFREPLKGEFEKRCAAGLESGVMDHGLLAGAEMRAAGFGGRQECFAREAARATALHNIFPALPPELARVVKWDDEPIGCLLLLCDQLQTWDRERNDEALQDHDRPQRAELAKVEVGEGKRPRVLIQIDYIAPSHVVRSNELYERVADELESILKARPDRALRMIGSPWPFEVVVECFLSGRRLETTMSFGGE